MASARKPLASGPALTFYAVVGEGGVCEVENWLDGLELRAKAQFRARFEQLTQQGYLRGEGKMRSLKCKGSPEVQEIKVPHGPGHRLYVIQDGSDWLATHGREKPKDRRVCDEANKARKIFEDYQERSR